MGNAQRFLDGYLDAWHSNDPETIRGLFAPDAVYRGSAHAPDPVVGVDDIVADWLAERDEPGTWSYKGGVDIEGAKTAVIRGTTAYTDGPTSGVYDNIWLVRFDDEGRAVEFQDWWFERKG